MPKPTVNSTLLDLHIHHQINLQRYGAGVVRDIIGLLNDADKDLISAIYKTGGEWSKKRLEKLLTELRAITDDAYWQAERATTKELKAFALDEADYAGEMILRSLPVKLDLVSPSAEQLAAIVTEKPFQGGLLSEWFSGLAENKQTIVRQQLRLGMAEGETIDQMVRRLAGTRAGRYADGALDITRRNAEAVVRTAVNHVSNSAQQLLFSGNGDIVKGWTFLATLDSRTTITCSSLSGTEWKVGEGPIPPRHVRCRSFAIPKLKSFRELGIDMDELPPAQRASMGGPVAADISFDEWLRTQPGTVQKDILGATRQKLFSEGMKIDRFTDRKGVVYDLKELRARNAEAFERLSD